MNNIGLKSSLIIALLFLVDFVTFLAGFAPVAILKVIVYAIVVILICNIWRSLPKNVYARSYLWSCICLYLLLLFFRLSADFFIPGEGFFLYKSPATILFFFIMTMVFPYVLLRRKWLDIDVSKICVVCCVVISLCLATSLRDILSGAIVAATTGGQYDAGALDIISYGHYGLTLLLISIYVWVFSDSKWLKLLMFACAFLGTSGIVLSGSRSPIIALVVCVLLFFVSRYRKWYYIIPLILLLYLFSDQIAKLMFTFNDWLSSNGIHSFNRVVESLFGNGGSIDDVSSGRTKIYKKALEYITENPFLGYGYLLPDKSYVHNIFIENFMALGFFGGSLFVIINIAALKRCIYVLRHNPKDSIFAILFVQYLIYGLFSRTTIAIAPYWLFMFLVFNIYDKMRYEHGIRNNTHI